MITKYCGNCKLFLKMSSFSKDASKKDGCSSTCKECKKRIRVIYIKNNINKIKNSKKEWHIKNKEKNNKISREYYKKNKKTILYKKFIYIKTKSKLDIIFTRSLLARAYVRFVLKESILELDSNKCVLCGSGECLQIHHIFPVKMFPELIIEPKNLITVCKSCHFNKCHLGSWHKINEDLQLVLQELANLHATELNVVNSLEGIIK